MIKILKNGLFTENPTFIQLLGMCPTMAVTTTVFNGFGMGLAATAVLIGSNVTVSLLRRWIPGKVRIATYVVLISGFVTLIQMLLSAFLPSLSDSLGLFLPLIVVNCIILARAEAFASKNGVLASAVDGLGMGLGFTGALVIISAVREILGQGTLFSGLPFAISIPGYVNAPATVFALPAGGFLTLGIILGIINAIRLRKEEAK